MSKFIPKTVGQQFVNTFLEEVGALKLPDNDRDKQIVKSVLIAILDYAIKEGVSLDNYQSSSIVRTIENAKALKLDPMIPNNAYITVYNGSDVRIAPFKHGFTNMFEELGADVQYIANIWSIREKDHFVPAKAVGLKTTDAEYQQNTTYGPVIKVVVQYVNNQNEVRYLMAERNNIIPSLVGHILKMARDKNQAEKIIAKINELDDIDKAYDYVIKTAPNLLSPAWRNYKEQMFETKMINHAVRNHRLNNNISDTVKRAWTDVVDAEYQEVDTQATRILESKVNDQKLDDDIKDGVIGSEVVEQVVDEPIEDETIVETNGETIEILDEEETVVVEVADEVVEEKKEKDLPQEKQKETKEAFPDFDEPAEEKGEQTPEELFDSLFD